MKKIGIVFSNKISYSYKSKLIKQINYLPFEIIIIENKKNDYKTFYDLGEMIQNKIINKGIIIDDFGTLSFMILGKMNGLVVAQIADEHSAHMTSEHNGANVICLGTKLNSIDTINNIVNKFVETPFAAGRHLVRLDMLNEMLKKEVN